MFCVDMSARAVACGLTTATIQAVVSAMQGLFERTEQARVGIVSFDSAVHFYSLRRHSSTADPFGAPLTFTLLVISLLISIYALCISLYLHISLRSSFPPLSSLLVLYRLLISLFSLSLFQLCMSSLRMTPCALCPPANGSYLCALTWRHCGNLYGSYRNYTGNCLQDSRAQQQQR